MVAKERGCQPIKMFMYALNSQSTDEFPDNLPQKFTCKLPCTFHLNENWEVSLLGISLPKVSNSYLTNPTVFEAEDSVAHIRVPRIKGDDSEEIYTRNSFELALQPGDTGEDIIKKHISTSLKNFNVNVFMNEDGHCQIEGIKGHIISFSSFVQQLLGWTDELITITRDDGIVVSPKPVEKMQPKQI